MLEERVNDKKEQLLEKDLVLEEVSTLANRLRAQALEGRGETLELAKRVNDFQARIKNTTRTRTRTRTRTPTLTLSLTRCASRTRLEAGPEPGPGP